MKAALAHLAATTVPTPWGAPPPCYEAALHDAPPPDYAPTDGFARARSFHDSKTSQPSVTPTSRPRTHPEPRIGLLGPVMAPSILDWNEPSGIISHGKKKKAKGQAFDWNAGGDENNAEGGEGDANGPDGGGDANGAGGGDAAGAGGGDDRGGGGDKKDDDDDWLGSGKKSKKKKGKKAQEEEDAKKKEEEAAATGGDPLSWADEVENDAGGDDWGISLGGGKKKKEDKEPEAAVADDWTASTGAKKKDKKKKDKVRFAEIFDAVMFVICLLTCL